MIPTGMIAWYSAPAPPIGWLECNGQSTAAYPSLAAIVGPNVPDLRGEFIRGWTHDRLGTTDDGRMFNSWQEDQFQGHAIQFSNGTNWFFPMDWNTVAAGSSNYVNGNGTAATQKFVSDGINGTPRIGNETRSRNVALLPCIKY